MAVIIVYLSRYLDIADPVWTQSDGEIFQSFISGLEHVYPDFSVNDIIDWAAAPKPLRTAGYFQRLQQPQT